MFLHWRANLADQNTNTHWKLIYVSPTIPSSQYETNLWSTHVSFGGGAVFQKKGVRTRRYFSRLRLSWRLRRQISLDYITTALPPNLSRLLHNTASYAGYFSWIIDENAPWSSMAKSMLPGNAKCSMTSLADTKHIFWGRKIDFFQYGASNFATGWYHAQTATRL